jgi:hypothetical protein
VNFRNRFVFYGEGLLAPSWKTAPCRLSVAAYSIHSQIISIAGGRPFHGQPVNAPCCCDKRTHLTWSQSIPTFFKCVRGQHLGIVIRD